MNKCQGPCLPYCSTKYSFLYIALGFFLGLLVTTFLIKYFLKKQAEKLKINKIETLKDKYLKNIREFLTNE